MFCKQTIQHSEDMAKYNDDFAYKKYFCMADGWYIKTIIIICE